MYKPTVEHKQKISKSLKNIGSEISRKQSESWTEKRKLQYSLNHGKEVINDLTGKKFGTLTVLKPIKQYDNRWFWFCICDCGNTRKVRTTFLVTGRVTTCELEAKQNANAKYKKEAKYRNISFDLTKEQFVEISSRDCYHCGEKPKLINYSKNSLDPKWGEVHANGVDRIDSKLGYNQINCVSSCWRCNSSKNDQTLKEFRSWVERTYEHMKSKGHI